MEHDWQVYADNAIAWARQRLGSTAYTSRCLAFVEDAYERPNHLEIFGGDFARESAELYAAQNNSGTPPTGAFVFYDNTGELLGRRQNWGHVGLCIGDGQVIHAWDRVRIDHYLEIQNLVTPSGWDSLRWIGWAPIQRIFQGCQPKDWTATGDAAAAAQRMQAARFGDGAGPT
ncbi:NlpC/P60 family protein [Streptomyces exfoliatus]|uniref:NlpC/P60 family protein n=1 Tax=Streptomyces exfoliatus TaxID=1905 RepID=UPI003C2EC42B